MSSDGSVHDDDDNDEVDDEVEGEFDAYNKEWLEKKGKRKRDSTMLRKAPQAPKRFKSSYICFFMAKQPEIKEELGENASVAAISKRSAELWKNLTPQERAHWEEVAAKDKQRYMVEKSTYTGPWQVPWKRAKKDPSAPKRPMSAFLYFSQGRRSKIKSENADMKNTEVSRILGEMWRAATEEERRPYIEMEKAEREKYKVATAQWKEEFDIKKEAELKTQSEHAMLMMEHAPHMGYPDQYGQPQYMYGQPYVYPPYVSSPGPYPFPAAGKGPVVLGPTGTPVYAMSYAPPSAHQLAPTLMPSGPHPSHGHYMPATSPQTYEDDLEVSHSYEGN